MAGSVVTELKAKMLSMRIQVESLSKEIVDKENTLEGEVKKHTMAEAEVASLQKRIRQLEDELESTETRLQEATAKLEEASKAADESDRGRKVLENRTIADEERINQLEEQLKESTFMAEDADRKYDEAARKLTITEVELERAESRLEAAESRMRELQAIIQETSGQLKSLEHHEVQTRIHVSGTSATAARPAHNNLGNRVQVKITELEEELRIVGNNVKSLEISEQEAAQREEAYEENIRDLTERLKAVSIAPCTERHACHLQTSKQRTLYESKLATLMEKLAEAEDRAQESERLVNTLQADADRLEGKINQSSDPRPT
ncbi:tropomyosin 1 [Paragonimus westermani]|uniref:Tropomyosin 1 n=1 Tax=Paragonimus westermani TaxID=34504 RepID=A0A5J4P2W9_9TREM|nr:tropomyosin 1 [Paragonimus westermani]